MIELFSFEFIRNALIASLLVSIASGIVGTLVVVNRLSFIAGGVAHAAYGGLGLAAFLGWSPMAGTIPFSLASSLLIGFISRNQKERADTIIGVVWAAGMAIGIILIDLTPGYFTDLMSYLFGSIMAVSGNSLLWMAVLDICVIALISFFFKEILAMSYDPEFASLRGIPVRFFYYMILCMVALTVVLLIKAVGLILVIALFTIPASIAELFTNNLQRMMIWSVLLGCVFTTGGILAAYFLDLTAGATIIMFACCAYGISYSVKKVLYRKRNRGLTPQPPLRAR